MPISADELSMLSEAEATMMRLENRAWSKELRRSMAALVNSRMAHQISHEEYLAGRKAGLDDKAECERRMAVLGR